ncbi:hypothetical protein C0J52_25250, partial [Blattella germanica]
LHCARSRDALTSVCTLLAVNKVLPTQQIYRNKTQSRLSKISLEYSTYLLNISKFPIRILNTYCKYKTEGS